MMAHAEQRSASPDVESLRELDVSHEPKQGPTSDTLQDRREWRRNVDLTFDTAIPYINDPHFPDLTQYESPFDWSSARKAITVAFCCLSTFLAAYSAGSYSISSEQIRKQFNIESNTAFQTGITVWCVGFASSPMCLAPLSELRGRRPVFLFSGCLFLVSTIGCAATDSFAGMLVARFFVGAGASTFATMCGGVIADIFHAQDRNTPMALYSAHALAGTGVGPLVCGFVVSRVSWRWVFWHQAIAMGLVLVLMAIFFKETRGSVLLVRRAAKINNYLQAREDQTEVAGSQNAPSASSDMNVRYMVASSVSSSSVGRLLYLSLTTPFKLLFTEPVVAAFSAWAAFAWGVLYLQLSVLPLVFSTNHGFNIEQQGAVFASLVVGVLLAVTISIYQEKLARRWRPKLLDNPEGRLYFACLEAALLPIGLFWFGWSSFSHIPWIVPCMGAATATMGIFSVYLSVFNYLADVYHRYASSALACQSFCRNILAAVFPLFSQTMFKQLGFPAASSLLGGVAAFLTIVPWVLVFKGEQIRARSKVASEIVKTHG